MAERCASRRKRRPRKPVPRPVGWHLGGVGLARADQVGGDGALRAVPGVGAVRTSGRWGADRLVHTLVLPYGSSCVVRGWLVGADPARRWGRPGTARRRSPRLLQGSRRAGRLAGWSPHSRRGWRGRWQSPTGWPTRRSGAGTAGVVAGRGAHRRHRRTDRGTVGGGWPEQASGSAGVHAAAGPARSWSIRGWSVAWGHLR